MEKIICDTDVMIDYLNREQLRHRETLDIMLEIDLDNVALSAMTKMELLAGVKDKSDLNRLIKNIGFFNSLSINHEITLAAVRLLEIYKLSHGLAIPDALIAATASVENLPLFTYNQRDFKFITDLKLYKY